MFLISSEAGGAVIRTLLERWAGHERFLDPERVLRGCRLRKEGGRLFADDA